MGATVHLHYCMDKLISWGLSEQEGGTCDKCGMEKKEGKNCCKDESTQVKLKVDQKVPQTIEFLFQPIVVTSFIPADLNLEDRLLSLSALHPQSHAPPLFPCTPVYLRNCVFLI